MDGKDDYYATLGVEPGSGVDVIKQSYRRLARRFHPDLAADGDAANLAAASSRMAALNEAYAVLSNAASRARYDRELGVEGDDAGTGAHQAVEPPAGCEPRERCEARADAEPCTSGVRPAQPVRDHGTETIAHAYLHRVRDEILASKEVPWQLAERDGFDWVLSTGTFRGGEVVLAATLSRPDERGVSTLTRSVRKVITEAKGWLKKNRFLLIVSLPDLDVARPALPGLEQLAAKVVEQVDARCQLYVIAVDTSHGRAVPLTARPEDGALASLLGALRIKTATRSYRVRRPHDRD